MFLKQEMSVIITIVSRGYADNVLEAAKKAGAEGATMFYARGNGIHENDSILGVSIQPEKEVILIVVRKNIRKKVMRAICVDCGMNEEGRGLCFSLPIEEIGGVNHWMELAGSKRKASPKPAANAGTPKASATAAVPDEAAKLESQPLEINPADNSKKNTPKIQKNS